MLETLGWIFCHCTGNNAIYLLWKAAAPCAERRNRSFYMLLHDFLAVCTAKYAMSSEHAIEHSTQSVNICICIRRLTQQLLWRWSTGRTIAIEQISLRFWSAQFEHTHDAKVR